jgi:hypothetical protein
VSGALAAVQTAMLAVLRADAALLARISGLYDGPPSRPLLPYALITSSAVADWSHKSGLGREVSIGVAAFVDEGRSGELHAIADAIERALDHQLAPNIPPEWKLVTFRYARTRMFRVPDGPWSAIIDYRAQLLQR